MFVVCSFCINIGFSDVNLVLVIVSVIVEIWEVCFDIFAGVSYIFVIMVDIVNVEDVVMSSDIINVGDVVVSSAINDAGDDGFVIFRGVSDIVVPLSDIVDVGDVCFGILRGVSGSIGIAIDLEVGIAVLNVVVFIVIVTKFVDSKSISIH